MANNFKLYEYMEARGIEEENIQRMKDEKIDSVVINMMTDEALKQFVPRLGDRIALRSFCKKEKAPSNANSRKDTILTKLRHKLNKRKTKSSSSDEECGSGDTRSSSLLGNTNAQKNERKIDVGWLDYDFASGTYKQVRKHKGGGTRQLSVAKNIGYPELLTIAQDLFFKDGFSSRGELSEFRSEICDFRQRPLPDDINVGQLYTETKMAVLRFYLQTTSTNKGKTKRMKTNTVDLTEEMDSDASADLPFVDISNESQSSCPTTIVQPDTPTIVFGLTNSPATEEQLNDTVPDAEIFKDDNDMLNVPELDSRPTPCVPSTSSGSMNPSSSRSKNESAYLSYVDLCTSDSENDDEGLLQAIKNSLADAEHQTGTPMDIPLQDLILNYQSQHCIDEYHTIIVHRKRFLRSILYAYTQPGFNCQKQVHCEFAGEEAVDVGGPKREMFRLLMKAVCEELGVLEGEVGKQSFTHNIELLEKQKYTVAGSFVAWSLLHGGPGLPTLHPELFKLMCGLKSKGFDDVNIISDIDVRLKLSKIANCRTSEEYTVVAQELGDWAADQGVPSLYGGNFTQKDIVVASLLKHFMFYSLPGVSEFNASNRINEHFAAICNDLPPLDLHSLPAYLPACSPPPIIHVLQVQKMLNDLNPFKAGHPDDPPIRLIKDFAPELATPVTNILNSALKKGIFPEIWKKSTAIPVPKVKNAMSLNDLRPISLTPILARVFEKFIVQWILDDIKDKFDCKQFGSRKKSSTTHYLISLIDSILSDVEKGGNYVNICTIDFMKAFDRVDHSVVVRKLIDLGVRSSIVPIICSFLSGRAMNTRFAGTLSSYITISCGVPQGTLLGPVLFLVLINDALIDCCRRWKYVDDLTLGEVIPRDSLPSMQSLLDNLNDWCLQNNMVPKPSKCHILTINFLKRKTPEMISPNFSLNGSVLDVVDHVRLLGVIIQNNLKWDRNIEDIVSRASRRLFSLCILKKANVSIDDLTTVYTSYIRPVLEYAAPVWHGALTLHLRNALERVQKRACRIILGADYIHYVDALAVIKLPSLEERREMLTLTFGNSLLKSEQFRDMLPPYYKPQRTLRSSRLLEVPKFKTERFRKSPIPTIVEIINRHHV